MWACEFRFYLLLHSVLQRVEAFPPAIFCTPISPATNWCSSPRTDSFASRSRGVIRFLQSTYRQKETVQYAWRIVSCGYKSTDIWDKGDSLAMGGIELWREDIGMAHVWFWPTSRKGCPCRGGNRIGLSLVGKLDVCKHSTTLPRDKNLFGGALSSEISSR